MKKLGLLLLAGLLSGCVAPPPKATAPLVPTPKFTPVAFESLPGWMSDNTLEAKPALLKSCEKFLRLMPSDKVGADGSAGQAADWQPFCRDLIAQPENDEPGFRSLLHTYFQPYALTDGEMQDGLFTGYYEASLVGSKKKGGEYLTPLYKRPPELITVDLGQFRDDWKGMRTAGRVEDGKLKPYDPREKIVEGSLEGRNLELLWLNNPIDAFFVQVQGSGRVKLPDGTETRIGYDSGNGQLYSAIGKELIERGALKKEEVTMNSIRDWLGNHPEDAATLMNTNKSYVFFREMPLEAGPVGAENTVLTPERSLAIDTRYIPFGAPVWLEADDPRGGQLRRLMVAQDTGGAINGVVRGDFFWGAGPAAEDAAGKMKSEGRYFVMLPKTVHVAEKAPAQ